MSVHTITRDRAANLAVATEDAYMAPMYGEASWRRCCYVLLRRGYTEREAEAILRSKIMRWADDGFGHGHGFATNSAALVRYLDILEGQRPSSFRPHATFLDFVRDELVPETFDD